MQPITFEDRAVAFLDVLGFSALVLQAAENPAQKSVLEELVCTLTTAVPDLDGRVDPNVPRELIPRFLYISDCIILSAPLKSEKMQRYDGVSILVMRAIQLSHLLLDKGFLICGGISIGKVWHTDSNIVGPAYQEAFSIEQKNHIPCVKLSDSAAKHWRVTEPPQNKMCLDYDGEFIVNGLHDSYIKDKSHGAAEKTFLRYKELAENRIGAIPPGSAQEKWKWFQQYLQSEIDRNVYIVHA